MTRSRESAFTQARAVAQTLTDGSVAWNVNLYADRSHVATIGVMGGETVARRMAARIEKSAAWVQGEGT